MRIVHLRPGEGRRLVWLAAIAVAYAAATSLGDTIAQSVFVARVGADALPRMFLLKGALDVVAAALYVPLTRGRSTARVWRVATGIYVATVLGARGVLEGGGALPAYALYVGHECAWTILTIHWGVFILDAFDASQGRRLFPVLFTAARLGGVVAGAALDLLAGPVGAVNLLVLAAGCAAVAGLVSLAGRAVGAGDSRVSMPAARRATTAGDGPAGLWAGWRRAASSPLVRAIALSTAAMVLVRYGLRMVSIDRMSAAFHHDEDMLAGFLGWFGTWANAAGAVLGVLVVPRLLTWVGVGAANLLYALATLGAYGALTLAPGLWSAALARFINMHLKDALKTPLSTLFYGAEPPRERALARAFIFGAVIPVATVATAALFEVGKGTNLMGVAWMGAVVAGLFIVACAVQNRRWRRRMVELLRWKLARAPGAGDPAVARARRAVAEHERAGVDPERLEYIARGLASPDARVRAVAEEVLAETIPRRRAHEVARPFVNPREPERE